MNTTKAFVAASSALVLVAIGIISFGIFRSFDWTDEAWAYSLISNAKVTSGEPWGYQYLLHPVFQLSGETIVAMRFIRLALYVLLGILSAFAALKVATRFIGPMTSLCMILVFASAQFGTILAWTWQPRDLAYNELASIGLQLAVVLLAFIFAGEKSLGGGQDSVGSRAVTLLLWLCVGILVGLLFYAKFVTSIAGLVLLLISPLFILRRGFWVAFLTSLSGLGFGLLLPVLCGLPITDYGSSVLMNLFDENSRTANAHSGSLLEGYLRDVVGIILTFLVPIVLSALAFYFARSIRFKTAGATFSKRGRLGVGNAFFALAVVSLLITAISNGFGAQGTGTYSVAIIFLALLLGGMYFVRFGGLDAAGLQKGSYRGLRYLILIVVLSPFAIELGTNNPLIFHLGYEATIWATLLGLSAAFWTSRLISDRSRWLFIPATAVFVCSLIVSYFTVMSVRNPYRSPSMLLASSTISEPHLFAGLMLSPSETQWATWLQNISQEHNLAATPTISLRSPGSLLVFNNSDFTAPWLDPTATVSYEALSRSCQAGFGDQLVILEPATEMNTVSLALFEKTLKEECGLQFPDDFDLIGQFPSQDPRYATAVWLYTKKAN